MKKDDEKITPAETSDTPVTSVADAAEVTTVAENTGKKSKKEKKTKKSRMPEGYIGRPKAMKTKKFQFHKPGKGFYIGLGFVVAVLAFLTVIVIKLVNVGKITDAFIKAYSFDKEKAPETLVIENDNLKMEMDVATTQFTILQKDSGHLWYSNPQNADKDPVALTKEKNNMKSTLLIKYSTENGVDNIYDTYTYSIKRDFFDASKKGDVITVHYTASTMEREYKYPLAIYESEMDEYLEQLSTADQNVLTRRCYRLVDIESLRPTDGSPEEMLSKYPDLEEDNLYLIFDPLNTYLKENCEKIFAKIDYSDEDYIRHKEMYKEKTGKSEPAFNITVNYKLDGDKLIVDIPYDELLYKQTYPIVQLSVLPYFGAAGTEDEGFMFVPEGSGALIDFNNGKTKQNGYYADIYGWDWGTDRKALITETRAAYPVFGEAFGESSFISIIENGASYAGITAEISGKLGSYNYVRADYKMVHSEQFEVSARNTSAQYAYEPSLPEGEGITQVYKFLNTNSYVDMAKAYRQYLFPKEKKLANKNTPVAVEIVGAVDKVQQVFGMPKTMPYKLTTYSEAADIITEIEEEGIKDASIKLSGFINEGMRPTMLKKFKVINKLGGKSGFKKLASSTEDKSSKIYLDGSTMFAYRSGAAEGFNRFRDPARFVSSEVCELSEYSPIWFGKLDTQDTYYLLSGKNINRASDVLIKNAVKYGFDGISYRENGYILSADYNDDNTVSREMAKKYQMEKFDLAKENELGIMINAGNDYALKNADFITNMIFHGNSYAIIDKQIPFYQIALHGYRNYAGTPVNLGYEIDQIVLESAESGAGLYFTFMKESERALQESNYSEYYSSCFDSWKDRFADIYKKYNTAMNPVKNSLISDHEYLNDKVTVTTFDNGYAIYVNYGYTDYVTDAGVTIPAREYKVLQEGK